MINSAGVRKQNRSMIRMVMRDGNAHTKQSIAAVTGLSVATCNTLLNEMEKSGEVIGEKGRLNSVGPGTMLYQLSENFENYLCISFELMQGIRTFWAAVLSPTGKIIESKACHVDCLNYAWIEQEITEWIARYDHIVQIIVGTPSIAEHGTIRYSDIPELELEPLVEKLEQRFGLPVFMENDMRYKAYGYYKLDGDAEKVVTLVYFPSHIQPGTATIHKGTILTGANGFAGMVGFLSYDMTREQYLKMLTKETGLPLVAKAVTALIAAVNPDSIVFTGDILEESSLSEVWEACRRDIPEEYLPEFLWVPDFNDYYIHGMYQTAVDRREQAELE